MKKIELYNLHPDKAAPVALCVMDRIAGNGNL